MESQVASLNERCATLQKENDQNVKSLEELDTQHQQAVGKMLLEAAHLADRHSRQIMVMRGTIQDQWFREGTKACCFQTCIV